MKKFLASLLIPFLLVLGEQFPPGSNEIVEIDDFERPVCMIQNTKDSLIYIAAKIEGVEGKNEIVVVNSNLDVVSRVDSATAGFAIGVLSCINYDSFGNVWIGSFGGKFYRLKSGVLEERTLNTITATNTIQCFGTKVLIATDEGYYIYNSETDSVEELGFVDNNILGTAIDNKENIWLAAEINSMSQEPIIAYKAINNDSDWTEQKGSDSCLKDFFEFDIAGTIYYKRISFLSLFKGQIFIGGQKSLLIKNIGPGQWEESNFQDGPSFIGKVSFDSLGNLWSTNNYQVSKFNIEEKIETVYGYDENNLPQFRAVLCGSSFDDKIVYIATKGKVIKHNTDPTNTINDYNPKIKMVIKSAFVPTRIYNLRGQLVRTFAPNIKIELSRIDLSTGTYLLKDGSGSKKVFIKGL